MGNDFLRTGCFLIFQVVFAWPVWSWEICSVFSLALKYDSNLGGYQFYRFCLKDKPPFCWEVYKHDAPKRLRVNYLFQPCTHIPSTSTPIKFQSAGSSWIPQLDAGGGWYIVAKCLLSCQRVFFGSRNQLQCEKKYPRTKKYMASEDSSKWTSTKRLRVLVSKMFYFYHDPSGNDFQSDSYCSGCSHSQGASARKRRDDWNGGSATQGSAHFLSADSHEKHGVAFAAMGSTAWSLAEFLDWHQVRDCQECFFFLGNLGRVPKQKTST